MNWTPEQVQERENRSSPQKESFLSKWEKVIKATPLSKPAAKKRIPRGMNKTERAYDLHLSLMERLGEVKRHKFEGLTLKLAYDCRFTPDFVVEMPDGRIELHDTKACYRGKARPHVEDDALVKMRVAAEMFPFKVKAVWAIANGEWESREY